MARTVDLGVTRYEWIAGDAGLTTPAAPKLTEISLGKNISTYVLGTTAINPTSSDTVSEKGITDLANVNVPTIGNYEGNLVLFRDLTAGVPTANDPWDIFTAAGLVGWIVRRIGLPHSTAYAVGQKVSVFKFTTDNPQPSGGQSDGYLKLTVPLLAAGTFYMNVATVA